MANLISSITYINTTASGVQSWDSAFNPVVSYDGTYVAFFSGSGNLPPNSGNQHAYLKNLATGAIQQVDSLQLDAGLDLSSGGGDMAISSDGRYVGFLDYDSNTDVWTSVPTQVNVCDIPTNAVINESSSAAGVAANDLCGDIALSSTGRYVAFVSAATNLVEGDTNGVQDVFLKDTQTGAISRANIASNNVTQANDDSWGPSVSADGRYVVFSTYASSLDPSTQGSSPGAIINAYLKDMQTGALHRLTTSRMTNANGGVSGPITPDAHYTVLQDPWGQLYRLDLQTGTSTIVSAATNGTPDVGAFPSISDDGRFVAFESGASNLVPNDTNSLGDIFVKDLATGAIARVDLSASGAQSNSYISGSQISGDGHYVVFESYATNLVVPDGNDFELSLLMAINPFWVPPTPDLTASILTFNGSSVSYSINNLGPGSAVASTAGIYLSTDASITDTDTLISAIPIPSILGNGSYADDVSVSFPDTLTIESYYLGVIADHNSQLLESNETNNASSAVQIILGNSGDNILTGTSSNDTILCLGGNDSLDGGAGIDTALYLGNHALYNIKSAPNGAYTVASTAEGTDTLTNVERLQFADAKIAIDITGNPNAGFNLAGLANAGQVYRLYQASFNRAPDILGLDYWIGQADSSMPLTTIASGFTGSIEFQNTYGSLTNHQFVDQLYQNVLHRPGEAGGVAYWYSQIDAQTQTREQILVGFSESLENQVALIGVIQNGIDYTIYSAS